MIANHCQLPVIDDFRIDDILKGGQGAPLVPVGEMLLFHGFDGFVNLGGIANLSVIRGKQIRAWDLCPCNQVLNFFASKKGHSYDQNGEIARHGHFDSNWFNELMVLEFFALSPPKSLSNQWGKQNILKNIPINWNDGLHTYAQLISEIICRDILAHTKAGAKILFTGGGAFNTFLMELIQLKSLGKFETVIPDNNLISFKEALIFGFLGLLKMLDRPNVYATVTGAFEDSCAGKIHFPKNNFSILNSANPSL